MRIVRPTSEGDDVAAKREALLRPKVVGEFLRSYDGAALPSDVIAKNVLLEQGVPADRLNNVLELVVDGAKAVGFIREWGGKRYVDLAGSIDIADSHTAPASEKSQAPVRSMRDLPATARSSVSVGPGVHINIEIHIAADAPSETIEEIFRNMRRYVLTSDGQHDNDTTDGS